MGKCLCRECKLGRPPDREPVHGTDEQPGQPVSGTTSGKTRPHGSFYHRRGRRHR